MNSKIISKFAWVFGIIFIVFAVLVGVFNYEYDKAYFTSAAPASIFEYGVLIAIWPYLLAAVLLFVVAIFGSRAAKSTEEKEPEMQETKTQEPETQEQETEDLFKETQT